MRLQAGRITAIGLSFAIWGCTRSGTVPTATDGANSIRISDALPTIALLPDNRIEWVDQADLAAPFPGRIDIEKSIELNSKVAGTISDLEVMPGCSCTKASLDRNAVDAGGKTKLTFRVSHLRGIPGRMTIRLFSKTDSKVNYEIPITLAVDPSLEESSLEADPPQVTLHDDWLPGMKHEATITVACESKIDSKALKAAGSSNVVTVVSVIPSSDSRSATLTVAVEPKRAGPLDEFVEIAAPHGTGRMIWKIPVNGWLESAILVQPRTASLVGAADSPTAAGTVTLRSRGTTSLDDVDVVAAEPFVAILEAKNEGTRVLKITAARHPGQETFTSGAVQLVLRSTKAVLLDVPVFVSWDRQQLGE